MALHTSTCISSKASCYTSFFFQMLWWNVLVPHSISATHHTHQTYQYHRIKALSHIAKKPHLNKLHRLLHVGRSLPAVAIRTCHCQEPHSRVLKSLYPLFLQDSLPLQRRYRYLLYHVPLIDVITCETLLRMY